MRSFVSKHTWRSTNTNRICSKVLKYLKWLELVLCDNCLCSEKASELLSGKYVYEKQGWLILTGHAM